jgi:hypothetical protein
MRIIGRLGALILGIIGVIVGAIGTFVGFANAHIRSSDVKSHSVVGTVLLLAALAACLVVLFAPEVAAVLFLIAGVGFFYVLGWAGLFVAPFFIVAAILAYVDRRVTTAHTV